MICGIGTDIVEIARISRSLERFGVQFLEKIFAQEELSSLFAKACLPSSFDARFLRRFSPRVAARFAAKEAAGKALGTGLAVGLHNIHIYSLSTGQPTLHFFDAAKQRMQSIGATRAHLSLSHERTHAVAMVILEE